MQHYDLKNMEKEYYNLSFKNKIMTFLKSKKKCLFRSFTFIIQNSLCAGGTGGAAAFEATEAL